MVPLLNRDRAYRSLPESPRPDDNVLALAVV